MVNNRLVRQCIAGDSTAGVAVYKAALAVLAVWFWSAVAAVASGQGGKAEPMHIESEPWSFDNQLAQLCTTVVAWLEIEDARTWAKETDLCQKAAAGNPTAAKGHQ